MSKDFPTFAAAIFGRFSAMSGDELLTVDDPEIFATYLAAFPEGSNPIFRTHTEHDGSIDKQFIRNIGRCVRIKNGEIDTIWNVRDMPYPYDVVSAAMHEHVRSLAISGAFRTKERSYGLRSNVAMLDTVDPATGGPGTPRAHTFHHFHADVAQRHYSPRPDEARGAIATTVQVFQRGLEELTVAAVDTVLDLIDTNSLYRGAEFRKAVAEFGQQLRAYRELNSDAARTLFAWTNFDSPAARFRNTAIGSLVIDLSANVDLERAVRSFESKVAPQNYKRTSAPISTKMVEQAVATLASLGLESAVDRRFARLSDISVNDVLFADYGAQGQMKDGIAGLLASEVKPRTVAIVTTPIGIEEFLREIVPKATSMELVVGNNHVSNFVSLTAPVHADAGRLFKWKNGFAWSYDGEATDSIKQRVKAAGGKIDAEVRVSLAWTNLDDLDLHVHGPHGEHIFYGNPHGWRSEGRLDVDMNVRSPVRNAVENIFWNRAMPDGTYVVSVHNFTQRERIDGGFSVEVEAHGSVETFEYSQALPNGRVAHVCSLMVKNGRVAQVVPSSVVTPGSSSTVSREKWGVKTAVPTPVELLLASPNHWDGEAGLGNKHWLFMLKGCKNPEPARGIYNEFLRPDLEGHRKVFEVLGAKTKCAVTDDQLSGVGFSSTRQDKAVVVVKGGINRAYEVSF